MTLPNKSWLLLSGLWMCPAKGLENKTMTGFLMEDPKWPLKHPKPVFRGYSEIGLVENRPSKSSAFGCFSILVISYLDQHCNMTKLKHYQSFLLKLPQFWNMFRTDLFLFSYLFCLPPGFLPVVGPTERWCLQHLVEPCYVALGRALIWGCYPETLYYFWGMEEGST